MVKRILLLAYFVLFGLIFGGCRGIEGPWPGGPEWEAVEKLRHAEPELYYWYKNGVSEEQKTKDWIECGGYKDGTFGPYIGDLKKEQRANEYNTNGAYDRLHAKLQKCMKNKGYVH